MKKNEYTKMGVLYDEAEKLYNNQEYFKAIVKYKKILKLIDDASVHYKIGASYISLSMQKDKPVYYLLCIYHFNQARDISYTFNDDENFLVTLAYAYIQLEKYDKARDILFKVLDINKNNIDALKLLGTIEYITIKY